MNNGSETHNHPEGWKTSEINADQGERNPAKVPGMLCLVNLRG
jgi:hypothetical protein